MLKHTLNIQVEAPTKEVANQKKTFLEQIGRLDLDTLQILAQKSKKSGISQKLKQFQHLI